MGTLDEIGTVRLLHGQIYHHVKVALAAKRARAATGATTFLQTLGKQCQIAALAMQMLLAARKGLMVIVVQPQQGLCLDVAQSTERLEAIMSLRKSARWSHLNSR